MNFDFSRLSRADRFIGGGALAMFITVFLFKWYGGSASSSIGSVNYSASYSGWHTFTDSRWIWLLTMIVALGAVAISAGALKLESPVSPSVLVAGLGALSTLLILYRIVHHPSGGASGSVGGLHYSTSYGIKLGIWLGLISAAVTTYGGYLAMTAEGTTLADVRQQASQAVSNVTGPSGPAGDAPSVAQPAAPGESAPPLPPPEQPPTPPS